jgi:hypothetical protein
VLRDLDHKRLTTVCRFRHLLEDRRRDAEESRRMPALPTNQRATMVAAVAWVNYLLRDV